MFTNAMSSAEHSQSTAELCLHEVGCALAVFHRANARERDAAKRRRAALRAGGCCWVPAVPIWHGPRRSEDAREQDGSECAAAKQCGHRFKK